MKRATTLLLLSSLMACHAPDPSASRPQSMLGESNLRLLSENEVQASALFRALGALSEPAIDTEAPEFSELYALCTGIQISPHHVLTAGHCENQNYVFDKHSIADADSLNKLRFKAFGKVLRLLFDGEAIPASKEALRYRTESAPVYASQDLDFAIWQFQDLPAEGWLDIRQYSRDFRQLSLLAYPNGVPLTVAEACHGETHPESPTRILHDCDSMSGSSGGLLWDRGTGLPVGLHVQSSGKNDGEYYKGQGTFESAEQIGLNQAIDWESILRDLVKNSPALTEELQLKDPL